MSHSSSSTTKSLPCMLCGRTDDCIEKYGEKKTYEEHNLTLHYYCLLLSSGIWQRGEENEGIYGFLIDDIKKEVSRAKRLRCHCCKTLGASIGCVFPRCKRSYHYPCGVEKECIFQFMDSFRSYCWIHRPVQTAHSDENGGSSPCTICLENVDHVVTYHIIRGPCCKTSWFHRSCLQNQALSAGLFFFRCTVCNNKDLFQKEMLRLGIHIPERDASWELEENAFQDLLVRYQRCDVENCVCQKGREYNKPESKWEVIRCDCCGSSGAHRACASIERVNQTWECSDCQGIGSSPGKRSYPASHSPSEMLDGSGFGVEQPSRKCPRQSTTSEQVLLKPVQIQKRHTSDVLQDLRSQLRNSVYTMRVKRQCIWKSSLKCFRRVMFSPCSILQLHVIDRGIKNKLADVSLCQYFKLLLDVIQNSDLFEGSERKNLSLNMDALHDNQYYEAGRMLAVALVHGGPAPSFLSPTLFYCLIYDFHHVQPVLEDIADPNVLQAILTIQACRKISELKDAIVHYFEYLQKTGTLHLVQTVSDKALLVKDILAYHVIRRVQEPLKSFKQGLQTLGVLEKIQAYPSVFWSILCMKPEKLTAEDLSQLFTITYRRKFSKDQKCNAINLWEEYLEDTEDGLTAVSLENILNFATGLDSIPPAGFNPQPTVLFHYKNVVPSAQKNIHCMELPGTQHYGKFKEMMDNAISTALAYS